MKINYNELTRLAEIVRVARRGLGRLALASLWFLRREEARVRDVDVLVAHVKVPGPYQRLQGAVRKRRPRRSVRRIDLSDERCKQGNTSVTLPVQMHKNKLTVHLGVPPPALGEGLRTPPVVLRVRVQKDEVFELDHEHPALVVLRFGRQRSNEAPRHGSHRQIFLDEHRRARSFDVRARVVRRVRTEGFLAEAEVE